MFIGKTEKDLPVKNYEERSKHQINEHILFVKMLEVRQGYDSGVV